ncbi:MAG: hypothetical protein NTV34_14390, partial [Proteobacteria bacterium]|nr:hypothetical protein [Pseudomonadota bacterium]
VLALPGAGGSLSMDQGVWDFLMTASADEIKFAAAAGVSMQRQHSDNTPLIHSLLEYACRDSNWEYNRDGWLSRINAILDSGAPLESINQGGRTPLLTLKDCYEKKPQRELIKLLLERGAKADALDNYQRGIFYDYQPYTADDIPMLDQLFAKGADPRRISSYSLKGTLSCHTNSQGQRVPDEAGVTIVRYIIAKGAPLNLLAHEIMSRDDIACISALQKIFSNTFIATLNFTQNSSSTNYLPSRTYLEAVTNHVVEPQQNRLTDGAILAFLQKPEAKAYYMNVLTMTKSLVTQGMLAKNETVNDWNYSTILAAYNLLHFDLIRYLTDIGFRHPQFKMSHLYYRILGPDNACHWMSGNTYLPTQGGCMAPNNVVWSVPSTADHCTAPTSDHLGHCDSVGATGKVPLKDAHPGYCESKSDPEAGQYRGQTVRLWTTPTYKLLTAEIIAGGFAKFPLDTWVLFATDGDARGAVNIKTGQLKIINNLMDNSPAQVTHLCVLGNYGLNQ